jgi:hypothetical protein
MKALKVLYTGEHMEITQDIKKEQLNPIVKTDNKASDKTSQSTDFDKTLKAFITPDGANKVSEEDLFSALVQERIKKEKGDDALKGFQEILKTSKDSMRKPDGFVPMEDATKDALLKFQAAGKLTVEEANKIYSQAFDGAQLDANTEALYDGRGGKNDPTIAVATMEQALMGSRVKIGKFDSGETKVKMRNLLEPSNGKGSAPAGGAGDTGFLFKPESEKDKKLVVLLPPKLAGLISSVRLMSPSGDLLEAGNFSGNGNGGRDHYRFSKAGGEYPDGLTVEATLKSGEVVRYKIAETSERFEDGTTTPSPTSPASPSSGGTTSGSPSNSSGGSSGTSSGDTSQSANVPL